MTFVWTAYVTLPLVAIVVTAVLAYWIRERHADVRGSSWFVATLCFGAVWAAFHVVMLLAESRRIQWLAFVLASKAAVASFLAFAAFASRYSRADFHRHLLGRAAFGLAGALVLAPTVFRPVEEFLYVQRLYYADPFPYVAADPALPYVAAALLLAGLSAAGLFSLGAYFLSTPRRSGAQLVLLIAASLSVALVLFVGRLGVFPAEHLDHAVYGGLPFAVCASLALFRFNLFEVQPVARNAVVEEFRDPVFVLDGDRRLMDYNRAAAGLVPDVEDAIGRDFASLHADLAAAAFESGDGGSSRLALDGGGESRHYSVTVSRVDSGTTGDLDWYSVVLRDVTDLERSRWQLERQNERLDQVASTISHDLRNPIQVAEGRTELLEDRLRETDLDDEDRAALRSHLEGITDSTARMQEIVDDVLTIAREGKTVEETEPVGLGEIAREAWERVDTADAALTVEADRALDASRSRLCSILENLFRNSVEHGRTEATVTVGATADGFYVRDDGPGIPPEDRDRVFEYGYTDSEDGTGLGLSIVRTMAESHGWTVELDESDGRGARFVFESVSAVDDEERRTDTVQSPSAD